MTKKELIKIAKENKMNPDRVIRFVWERIRAAGTNWAATNVKITSDETANNEDFYIPCGYRKNTTGQYVPNSYRSKFGWKNTYYQSASLELTLNPKYFR